MKRNNYLVIFVIPALLALISCTKRDISLFWNEGNPVFDSTEIFSDERFPNVVVGTDGTVIASWGRENYRVRRSEDGGNTWEPSITIVNPGFQGGGTTVDENTGDIIVFVEEKHPVAPLTVYRSKDNGKTWLPEDVIIKPNSLGHIPSMHMNEKGITLMNSKYKGRLIRPTRYYSGGNDKVYWNGHYTNAIYSDDGGKTWQASEPFPAKGTGEAAIAELEDGTLYYNSRRHKSTDGLNPRNRHIAKSTDGGQTWSDMYVCEELPDGDQNRDYGLMGGLVRLPVRGYDILIFSNIESPEGRTHGTVWVSFDGGRSWPVKKLVEAGSFAYSSLAAGRKGTPSEGIIYLLYESGAGAKIARFNLAWLTDGRHWREFVN
jgi:sialidase-1